MNRLAPTRSAAAAPTPVALVALCPYPRVDGTAPTGTIAFPPAGTAQYANSIICDYLITTGGIINLRFDRLSVESTFPLLDFPPSSPKLYTSVDKCDDYVQVYDGTSATGTLKGTFCGTLAPPVQTATSGSMFVRFTSSWSIYNDGRYSWGIAMSWWDDTVSGMLTPAPLQPSAYICVRVSKACIHCVCACSFVSLCVGASSRVCTERMRASCRPCRCVPRLPIPYRHVHRADGEHRNPTCGPVDPHHDHLRLHDHDKRADLPTLRLVYDRCWP